MNFNLAHPVYEHGRNNGSRLAVSVGGDDLSYAELSALAQRTARWLTAGPSRSPGFVGVLASRSVEAYVGVLGACWAGDAYVPLNPQLPEQRLAQLLRIIQPVALVVDEAGRKALSGCAREACPPRILSGFHELPTGDPQDRPSTVDAEHTAYMIFTSGSTGVPKGVLVPTRAVCHLVKMLQDLYSFRPEDRFSKAYNLSFDGSVHDMFTSWYVGASLHPVPASQLMAPMKFIQERQLTVWTSVPSTAVFLEQLKMLQTGAFPSLRYSIFSGEPLPLRSALAWRRAAPNSEVDNICGHTECCVFSTLERLSDPPNVTPNRGLVAIGKPLPGFEAAVFDNTCTCLAPGNEGELALSGPQVAKGYFQDPERTAARFPVINGKTWYRTGDLVCQDESGIYHHLGRIDHQVKILGHRIELGEIEAHLSQICDSDSVAAVAWPVDHGSARGIVAFHCSEVRSPQEIRDAMRQRLPRYAVPTQVLRLPTMPLTTNGKVDRAALIEVLERPPEVW